MDIRKRSRGGGKREGRRGMTEAIDAPWEKERTPSNGLDAKSWVSQRRVASRPGRRDVGEVESGCMYQLRGDATGGSFR